MEIGEFKSESANLNVKHPIWMCMCVGCFSHTWDLSQKKQSSDL